MTCDHLPQAVDRGTRRDKRNVGNIFRRPEVGFQVYADLELGIIALRLQAKWYSNSLNNIMLVETTLLTQVQLPTISLADVRSFTFVLS